MALETGTVINDLTTANPASNDAKSQGDDHLRLIKTVLKNAFAGFTGTILLLGTEAQGGTVNDFVATISPAPAAYVKGMTVYVTLTHTNTGNATLVVNALAQKSLLGIDNGQLSAGSLTSGQTLVAYYDGTNFIVTSGNDKVSADGATYTGTHNFTSATVTMPQKATVAGQVYTGTHDYTAGAALVATQAQSDNSTKAASTAYADAMLAAINVNIALKANIASPTFTGVPAGPTAAQGTNTTQFASTAFVYTELTFKANLASPTFTGVPTVPTASVGTDTTQAASTAFVNAVAMNTALPSQAGQAAGSVVITDGAGTASWGSGTPPFLLMNLGIN